MIKNKNYLLIIFLFFISFLIFLFTLYFYSTVILEKKEIITTLSIGNIIAFDLNQTILSFGTIISNASSHKNLIIENNYDFPIKVKFKVEGDIEEFLVFDEIINLEIGEKKIVSINTIPINKDSGSYSGKIIIVVSKI